MLTACLERNPDRRLHDIRDWELLLDRQSPAAPPPRKRSVIWPWIAAAVLALAAAAGWMRPGEKSTAMPDLTFAFAPPPGVRLVDPAGVVSTPLISPDGSSVLFRAEDGPACPASR